MSLLFQFLQAAFFGMPFMVVYYKAHGLSQVDVNALQSTIAIVSVAAVIPCGHLADRLGVRRAMIGGATILCVTALAFWLYCATFWQFQLNVMISSLGWCAISGASSSHMAATFKVASAAGTPLGGWSYERYESLAVQARAMGVLAGIMIGSIAAAHVGMWLAFALQPATYAAATWAAWRLVEPANVAAAETHRYVSPVVMWNVAKRMLWRLPAVRWLVTLSAVLHVTTLGAFWLLQPKLEIEGVPHALFGFVYALRAIGTIFFARFGEKRMLRLGMVGGLTMIVLVVSVSLLVAVGVRGWAGVAMLFVGYSFAVAFIMQIERTALDKLLPGSTENRACELSVSTMVQSLAFACVSPLVGIIAEKYSVDVALFLLAAGCLVMSRVVLTLLRRASV